MGKCFTLGRHSLNKMSTVIGWFSVTWPWSPARIQLCSCCLHSVFVCLFLLYITNLGGEYSGFQVTGMIKGFFWVRKFGKYFFGVAWFFIGTFGGIKKNRYYPGSSIVLRIKYRLTNVFWFCLIVNCGVALHRTCYTIVCIVPWYPAVYKTSTTSIQSAVGFTVTEIPFCFSELLISFACELLRATKSAWDFFGVNFYYHFWSRDFLGFAGSSRDVLGSWLLAPFNHH